MIDYSQRSEKKEILDRDDIPFADIEQNMKELNFINTHLGGHSITIGGFKKIVKNRKSVSVCEIGCGGGDNLSALYTFCKEKNIAANFTGIDINAACIAFAKAKTQIPNVEFITSDYKQYTFIEKPDIIFSSLFCHHFNNEELITMLQWIKANCNLGFFINDLHRHPLAYNFIKVAANVFSKSYLVKNDAPLSVLRGFKKCEWQNIFQKSGIKNYTIQWKWAFRHLITSPRPPTGEVSLHHN